MIQEYRELHRKIESKCKKISECTLKNFVINNDGEYDGYSIYKENENIFIEINLNIRDNYIYIDISEYGFENKTIEEICNENTNIQNYVKKHKEKIEKENKSKIKKDLAELKRLKELYEK